MVKHWLNFLWKIIRECDAKISLSNFIPLSKWYIHLKGKIFFTYKIDMIFFFFQTPDSIEISYNTISLKGILAHEFKPL